MSDAAAVAEFNLEPAHDTGLAGIALIASRYGIHSEARSLAYDLGLMTAPVAIEDLVRAARLLGLKAHAVVGESRARLETLPRPALVRLTDDRWYIFDSAANGADCLIQPQSRVVVHLSLDDIAEDWTGEVVQIGAPRRAMDQAERFGLGWFLRSLGAFRTEIAAALTASLMLQIFGLATPLLFQVVIDKVLVHQSTATLFVVTGALVFTAMFEALLQYLRNYLLFHTGSRIDVILGSKLFKHLLSLPMNYFETRSAGQTVARVRELENIRAFLTGPALSSGIDLAFTFIYIVILWLYSPLLTGIVLICIPLLLGVTLGLVPILRSKLNLKFDHAALNQQFLVENIIGAATLKAASAEPFSVREWEEKLARYVRVSFEVVMLSSSGQSGIQFISKAMTAAILLFGALQVMNGTLTVGGLIAFNMIVGQFVAPVLRLSQLWQDFQQVQISVERVADIMNAPAEATTNTFPPTTRLRGAVELKNVNFRYRSNAALALEDVSLHIRPGEVLGIVGPSGSGKSTLTKLIQRTYTPETGSVLIDGVDLRGTHPAWFRRQIGVVLQENLLFNRSVHDNISLGAANLTRSDILEAARLAGAHDFIRDLTDGYDTIIEERGVNLSGGQRQRIAIARALARNPRVLIFDEATSALDYESERIIQRNMRQITRERTVIIVAHRLAAVRDCDRIVALDRGQVCESGTHEELLACEEGLYARLWRMQSEGEL